MSNARKQNDGLDDLRAMFAIRTKCELCNKRKIAWRAFAMQQHGTNMPNIMLCNACKKQNEKMIVESLHGRIESAAL